MLKRTNYICWNEYFMGLSQLTAQRSKDPSSQVGCVIVDDMNKIIGLGYNGLPNGCNDDHFSWNRPEKYFYIIHAEMNAIINCNDFKSLKGATLYTTLFPCSECAKIIIQTGIKKIIYDDDKYIDQESFIKSKEMLNYVKIPYIKYVRESS